MERKSEVKSEATTPVVDAQFFAPAFFPTDYNSSLPIPFNTSMDAYNSFEQSLWTSFANPPTDYSPQPLSKEPISRRTVRRPQTLEFRDKRNDFDESSFAHSSFNSFKSPSPRVSSLPSWAVDESGNLRETVTLRAVLNSGDLIAFASDKAGCHFLQQNYPGDGDGVRDVIFHEVVEQKDVFVSMCQHMFGNFFVQRIVEVARAKEQEMIMLHLRDDVAALCLDKCACRVVQIAVQKLDVSLATTLAQELRGANIGGLCIDQNGNHVIQKIVKTLPVHAWDFIVDYFCRDEHLIAVCQDKYGCRVVQSTIEKLSDNPKSHCYAQRTRLLHNLMGGVVKNCSKLASNEFANYVVQHIIKAGGVMETYRNTIIEKCLLRNLLSMSQEKYASHVVEVALLFAPSTLLREMMDEVFDGYVPHPETNRDALDILLFHQFGNYIIQQMIHLCCSAILGQKERKMEDSDVQTYRDWLERIKFRVSRNVDRLERFSSGKKIIDALRKMDNNFWSCAREDLCSTPAKGFHCSTPVSASRRPHFSTMFNSFDNN